MRRTRPADGRLVGDAGQVGGIEVLPLGVLVFVVGGLLLANAWAVVDARLSADSAARAAVRAAVEADDRASADSAARLAAVETLAGLGRDADRATIEIELDRPFGRCARLTATTRTWVPAITVPWIGGFGRRFDITGSSTEIIDPLRDGLDGDATCVG